MIIFAWLFAKERHLDKYRSLYLEKGFDVLSVKVYVKDFLIPQSGSQQIAANVIRFIMSNQDRYQSIILHAFSVGAYQLGELFVLLNKDCYKHARIVFEKALKGIFFWLPLGWDDTSNNKMNRPEKYFINKKKRNFFFVISN